MRKDQGPVDEAVRRAAAILRESSVNYMILAQDGTETVQDIEGNPSWIIGAAEIAKRRAIRQVFKNELRDSDG